MTGDFRLNLKDSNLRVSSAQLHLVFCSLPLRPDDNHHPFRLSSHSSALVFDRTMPAGNTQKAIALGEATA